MSFLLNFVYDWKCLEDWSSVHCLFLDLPHVRILLKPMYASSVDSLFLTYMYVVYDKWLTFSVVTSLFRCAVGWTALGLLLFCCILTIFRKLSNILLLRCSDDVALYKEVVSLSDCVQLQEDLNSIHLWASFWQLLF